MYGMAAKAVGLLSAWQADRQFPSSFLTIERISYLRKGDIVERDAQSGLLFPRTKMIWVLIASCI
ncbi:hypothetical protein BAR24_09570 [Gluconobacter oxydans]|nr:hypothetical protein BAR24_09570 [Gluconobacter oxydans]